MNKLNVFWQKIPPPVKQWLKGLEVAVVTGCISAIVAAPFADFGTKAGITKFALTIVATAGGCVRLYLAQSPIQAVLKESVEVKQETPAGTTTVSAEKISQ